MSELTDKLRDEGQNWRGTNLGSLIQWAVLHIESQDQALKELREEHAQEEAERIKLESSVHETKKLVQSTLDLLTATYCPPVELARDFAPHINLMAGHGDPDYLKSNVMSIRHVDLREAKPRKKK